MRFELFVPRRERNESLTGTGTVAEAAKARLEAVAYLPSTDGSIALLMTRFQQQRGSNRQERCFNQIHIDRLRGSVVERQTPVIPLGIAGVALVPPTRSRIRPPIPAHEDVLVCAAKTNPICPLPLRSGKTCCSRSSCHSFRHQSRFRRCGLWRPWFEPKPRAQSKNRAARCGWPNLNPYSSEP
jgi:hypothetical protein